MWELYNKLTGLRCGFGWCEFDTRKEAKQIAAQINEISDVNIIGIRTTHKVPKDEIYFIRVGLRNYLGYNEEGDIYFPENIDNAFMYADKSDAIMDICKLHSDDLENSFIVKYEMK